MLTRRLAKPPRTAAPEPSIQTPACCTWEVTAPRMSNLEMSTQLPDEPQGAVRDGGQEQGKSAFLCASATQILRGGDGLVGGQPMMMNRGTPKANSKISVDRRDALPDLPFVQRRTRW